MQSNKLGRTLHIVGSDFIILRGRYDPDQLWFEFMDRTIFHAPVEPDEKTKLASKHEIQKLLKAPLKPIPNENQPHNKHDLPKQMLLPFSGSLRLSNKAMNVLKSQKCQTFDRNSEGELYQVVIKSGETRQEIIEWCDNMCKGRFHIVNARLLTFEYCIDAVLAKMKFY